MPANENDPYQDLIQDYGPQMSQVQAVPYW